MEKWPEYYNENILEKYFCIDFSKYDRNFGPLYSDGGGIYQQVTIDIRRCDYD
jgi:hypothetical protein